MVTPDRRRRAVGVLQERFGVSQRRACWVVGQHRSTQRCLPRPIPAEEEKLRRRLRLFARRHPRLGWRKAHDVVRREGWAVDALVAAKVDSVSVADLTVEAEFRFDAEGRLIDFRADGYEGVEVLSAGSALGLLEDAALGYIRTRITDISYTSASPRPAGGGSTPAS